MPHTISRYLYASFWILMVACSALIAWNTLPYFDLQPTHTFIIEKQNNWADPIWRICFYNHIAAGLICLVAACLPFSKRVLKRTPSLHRLSGRIYAISVCLVLVPTGLYLSRFAKGGWLGASGFALNGILLFLSTIRGIQMAISRQFVAHRRWMIRSYSMAATAISFRLLFVGLSALTNLHETHAYIGAIWLSVMLNAIVAEAVIAATSHKGTHHETLHIHRSRRHFA
jgi:hypothetical protein